MRLGRLGIAFAAILALASPSPAAQTIGPDRHSWARKPEIAAAVTVLDAWIAATVAQREQPGLSIGIVYDQHLVWAKGYGFADLERRLPATPSTIYRIASISKLFTATAIMQLRDAGKLRLDDPVSDRLPWFSIKWKYSNLAVSLAGEIVAEVSGEPWPQYVERHILRPLGMEATRAVPERGMPGLAVGYGRRVPGRGRDMEPFVDIGAESPAGNLASNVEDLAKFVALQLREGPAGGQQILRGSTLREMHRVQWLRPDWQSGWGLGFSVRRAGDEVRISHGGSLPGQRTQIEIAPAQKLGVIVLTNANDGDPLRYVNQAFTLLSPVAAKAVTVPETPKVPEPRWQRYVGRYAWKFSEMQIQILNGELTMIVPEADNPWSSRMILRPVGPNTFRMVGTGWSYEPIGELLTFEMDVNEKVTRVRTPYFYWLPME